MLDIRRPPEQSQTGLSRASKIFFGCDIFQGKVYISDSYILIDNLKAIWKMKILRLCLPHVIWLFFILFFSKPKARLFIDYTAASVAF